METSTVRKGLILLSAFFVHSGSTGILLSLPVLYVEWLPAFRSGSAETAVVESVCNGVFSVSGMLLGILVTKFGPRVIGMLSATIAALGFSLSFMATSLMYLIFVFSIPTGVGLCGMYISSSTAIAHYFDGKQKHMAMSVASLGVGVGGICFTKLMNVLSLKYGWKGCMLIIGGMLLNNIPFNASFKLKRSDRIDLNIDSEKTTSSNIEIFRTLRTILKNKLYILNVTGLCCVTSALLSTRTFMVDTFLFKGFSRNDAVLLFLIQNITTTASRLLPGLLKQIKHVSIFALAVLHSGFGSVAMLTLPSVENFTGCAILIGCFGFAMAGTFGSVINITVAKTVDSEHFPIGLGFVLMVMGIINIITGPLTGYFRDVTGSYDASFYANGALAVCGVIFFIILLYLHTKKKKDATQISAH